MPHLRDELVREHYLDTTHHYKYNYGYCLLLIDKQSQWSVLLYGVSLNQNRGLRVRLEPSRKMIQRSKAIFASVQLIRT